MPVDPLQRAQLDFAARLGSSAFLENVGLHVLRPRSADEAVELLDRVNAQLGGLATDGCKQGITILLPLPELRTIDKDVPGPVCELVIKAWVLENPMLNAGPNGSGMTAEECAVLILQLGHLFRLNAYTLLYADREAMKELEIDENDFPHAGLGYVVSLTATLPLNVIEKVSEPAVNVSGGQVTVTCATSGAQIWLTLDGSFPHARETFAMPYAAAFTAPPSGTMIRAAAYLPGSDLEGSDIAEVIVP